MLDPPNFLCMGHSNTKTIVLNSEFEEIQKLEQFMDELQQWISFNDEDHSRIMLTLNEAATNAIVHGNQEDPNKTVTIEASQSAGNLIISVEDQGSGFNPDDLPDPLKEENLLNTGGRGVYLIKEYADKTTFSKNGRKLTMVFQLDDKDT